MLGMSVRRTEAEQPLPTQRTTVAARLTTVQHCMHLRWSLTLEHLRWEQRSAGTSQLSCSLNVGSVTSRHSVELCDACLAFSHEKAALHNQLCTCRIFDCVNE